MATISIEIETLLDDFCSMSSVGLTCGKIPVSEVGLA